MGDPFFEEEEDPSDTRMKDIALGVGVILRDCRSVAGIISMKVLMGIERRPYRTLASLCGCSVGSLHSRVSRLAKKHGIKPPCPNKSRQKKRARPDERARPKRLNDDDKR